MPLLFFELTCDEKFQDILFNDDPDEALPWEDTYYALIREYFGKTFNTGFEGFKVIPNSDNKKRRKNLDISPISACSMLVLSKKAVDCIGSILEPNGQFLPVVDFPWENYCAFHVTRVISNAVIWEKSNYREGMYGKILYRPTLKKESVSNEEIFMLEESIANIYVSQNLKEQCEHYQLKGLDFLLREPIQAI